MGEFPSKKHQFKAGKKHQITAKEAGAIGGRVKSQKKNIAQKFRWLKQKGITDENFEELVQWVQDREYSIMYTCEYLKKAQDSCKTTSEKIALAKAYMQLIELNHGKKNINLNLDVTKEWSSLKEFLEENTISVEAEQDEKIHNKEGNE
ncbi:hypothetical protein HOD38_00110 [archaeon]|nr:hypothetical protein [archaeon]MBT4396649.1 hypothetical protein [archaeon]MBT4441259.1 hypothetical protein [archaeon]